MERSVVADLLFLSIPKRSIAIFIALVLFCPMIGCTGNAVVHPQSLRDLSSGTPVQSSVRAGVSSVPLPTGDWIVLGHAIAKERARKRMQMYWYLRPISVTFLAEVASNELGDRELNRLVLIAANERPEPGWGGWQKWKDCERRDLFYLENNSNAKSNQDCWYVSHVSFEHPPFTRDVLSGAVDDAREYLKSNKILVPINMVYVKYRFASKHDALVVGYYFNPYLDGIAQTSDPSSEQSDWHVSRIRDHPEKYGYLTNLKVWGEGWYRKVKSGFESHAWWGLNTEVPNQSAPATTNPDGRTNL